MRIFLARHGTAIKKGDDSVLTKEGIKQAKNLAKQLSKIKFDFVFSSDLTRAKQTADEFIKLEPKNKTEYSPDIREIYRVIVGGPEKEGTPKDRAEKDKSRADNFLNKISNLKGKNVLVFCHGNIIRYFLSKGLGISPEGLWEKMVISHGSISIIEIANNKEMQVKAINLYQHQKGFLDEFFEGEITQEKYL
jgi:broad specificity phosphatase PhoE